MTFCEKSWKFFQIQFLDVFHEHGRPHWGHGRLLRPGRRDGGRGPQASKELEVLEHCTIHSICIFNNTL